MRRESLRMASSGMRMAVDMLHPLITHSIVKGRTVLAFGPATLIPAHASWRSCREQPVAFGPVTHASLSMVMVARNLLVTLLSTDIMSTAARDIRLMGQPHPANISEA